MIRLNIEIQINYQIFIIDKLINIMIINKELINYTQLNYLIK